MKNVKYTTDGKKVVIINDLNQTEKIVQEIFVNEKGEEIQQGEKFVSKNLLDEPAKSWKEKEIEKLELTFDRDSKEWNYKIEKLNSEKRIIYHSLSTRVKWLRNIAKQPREDEFKKIINLIADFISDSEKWVFVKNYSDWSLERFNEDGCNTIFDRLESNYGNKRFDSMRLLSLFGGSDGSLTFRINDYSDGSGSDKDVEFFNSKETALKYIQNEFDKIENYSTMYLDIANKFNLVLNQDKLKTYRYGIELKKQLEIKELEDRLSKLKQEQLEK